MKTSIQAWLFILGAVLVAPAFAAGDAKQGEALVVACVACHGDGGNSTTLTSQISWPGREIPAQAA